MRVCASEEDDFATELPERGAGSKQGYVAVFDPLDGSSNIDASIPTGTIFGLYRTNGLQGGVPFLTAHTLHLLLLLRLMGRLVLPRPVFRPLGSSVLAYWLPDMLSDKLRTQLSRLSPPPCCMSHRQLVDNASKYHWCPVCLPAHMPCNVVSGGPCTTFMVKAPAPVFETCPHTWESPPPSTVPFVIHPTSTCSKASAWTAPRLHLNLLVAWW